VIIKPKAKENVMAKKPKSIEHLDASIGRWKTRLKRAITMIDKLERQRKRLAKAVASPPATAVRPEPAPVVVKVTSHPVANPDNVKLTFEPVTDEIPAFLRRQSPDPVAEQIRTEIAETKRKKAAGRIAKMKAKKSGETKRMPLTGKAALAAIRNM
jgi:hypothetical protein